LETKLIPLPELLDDIVDNRGKTCPTARSGIPLIATNCVHNDRLYPSYDRIRFVSDEVCKTWFRGHPQPGDLIFVTKGTPGSVCIAPDPVDFCIAQDMVALRANSKSIYPKYLFAALRSKGVQRNIEQMHVGTLIPHFKKGDFDKLLLPVPAYPVQELIGDIYFELSAKMDLNRRMTETLRSIALTVFRSWFVFLDPVRANAKGRDIVGILREKSKCFPSSFVDTPTGIIPDGWTQGTLADAVDVYDSQRVPLSSRERAQRQGPYPYYGAASAMDHIDAYLFDGTYILVGEDGSVVQEDGTPIVQHVWGKFWVNNHAHVLKAKNGFTLEYLLNFLRSTNIRPFITGAVQPKLNQANLLRVPLLLPNNRATELFQSTVEPLYRRIRINVEENRTLESLRDSLLPNLMSGSVRFKQMSKMIEVHA
jgi:type I restriction enzyme S subunit